MPRSAVEVRNLVDEGIRLEAQIDPLSDRLKEVKGELKSAARDTKTKELIGILGTALVSDDEDVSIEYDNLVTYLKKNKLMDVLPKLRSVLTGAVRKELGEAAIKAIATVVPKPYSKCKLKAAKGLDLIAVANLDLSKTAEVLKVVEAAKARVTQEEADKAAKKKTKQGASPAAQAYAG
jgi:hypothetical protein